MEYGAAVVNIAASDIQLLDLAVHNSYALENPQDPARFEHQFAVRGFAKASRIITDQSQFASNGADTMSLWNKQNGVYLHRQSFFSGRVDLLWFDGGWERPFAMWKGDELIPYIRSLQPDILINDLFPADSKNQTLAHELGHGIHYEVANGKVDKFAKGKTMKGEIDKQSTPFRELPTSVKKELREVYHDAHTVSKEQFYHEPSGPRGNISPETQEYSSSATNEELMAEFFVVLRADPNYAKTIAPKAYQWLAEQIDAHPELRKTVQLNSVGGGLAGLLAMKMMEEQEGQQ